MHDFSTVFIDAHRREQLRVAHAHRADAGCLHALVYLVAGAPAVAAEALRKDTESGARLSERCGGALHTQARSERAST